MWKEDLPGGGLVEDWMFGAFLIDREREREKGKKATKEEKKRH